MLWFNLTAYFWPPQYLGSCFSKEYFSFKCFIASTYSCYWIFHFVNPHFAFFAYPHSTCSEIEGFLGLCFQAVWSLIGRNADFHPIVHSYPVTHIARAQVWSGIGLTCEDYSRSWSLADGCCLTFDECYTFGRIWDVGNIIEGVSCPITIITLLLSGFFASHSVDPYFYVDSIEKIPCFTI